MATTTARNQKRPIELVRQAAGSRAEMAAKLARLAAVFRSYANTPETRRRLRLLKERGHIRAIPTATQLAVGAIDMLRFWISPAADEYYQSQNINYWFHQLLRFLDEPASLTDPLGIFSSAGNIIGHLMQVVHADPVYDLQLLEMFADGLDELERQLQQMIDGTHPRAASIGAVVEEAGYHERLLDYVQRWRRDRSISPLLRDNIARSEKFRVMQATFGTMTGSFDYFLRLPRTLPEAALHLLTVHSFEQAQGRLRPA